MPTIVILIQAGGVVPRLKGIIRSVRFSRKGLDSADCQLVLGSSLAGALPGSSVSGGGFVSGPMIAGHAFSELTTLVPESVSYDVNQPIDVNTLLTMLGDEVNCYAVVELS